MDKSEAILKHIQKNERITSQEVAQMFGVSRQYAARLLADLVTKQEIIKIGTTRSAYYVLPNSDAGKKWKAKKTLTNKNLEEHEVLTSFKDTTPLLPDNIESIIDYAFSEMLNNAIDHSQSPTIECAMMEDKNFTFTVRDFGIGVFRNIMNKRLLNSELEAVQDLLKGKTTTAPQAHSGEGIFFTSKIADVFTLESFGWRLTIDNTIDDLFLEEVQEKSKGTLVTFSIATHSDKHLINVFKEFQSNPETHAFDKTEIQIKLYTMGTVHVSRSQARRILSGLEKFKTVILDFENVPTVGQAFADELFRVYKNTHPEVAIIPKNMNDAVRFMIERTAS